MREEHWSRIDPSWMVFLLMFYKIFANVKQSCRMASQHHVCSKVPLPNERDCDRLDKKFVAGLCEESTTIMDVQLVEEAFEVVSLAVFSGVMVSTL